MKKWRSTPVQNIENDNVGDVKPLYVCVLTQSAAVSKVQLFHRAWGQSPGPSALCTEAQILSLHQHFIGRVNILQEFRYFPSWMPANCSAAAAASPTPDIIAF